MPADSKQWTPPDDDFDYEDVQPDDEALEQALEEEWSGEEALYDEQEPLVGNDLQEAKSAGSGLRRSNLIRLVVALILLAIVAVVIVRALTGGGAKPVPTPTVVAQTTPQLQATFTATPQLEGGIASPTPEELLSTPTVAPLPTAAVSTGMGIGSQVKVAHTDGSGARLRAGAGSKYVTFAILDEGKALTITAGPLTAEGIIWWRVKSKDGMSGWMAQDFLESISQ